MALYENQHLKIYNSLSGEKELFTPIHAGAVGMYVCGPTVYSNVHLGNVRTFMSFDVIYRYLLHLGYKVRYVRNITDAGHLENDAETGEDRIAKKARIEELEPMEIVQRYTVDFHNVLNAYNFLPPSIEPTATGHIVEQIQIIEAILEKGLAYESNGSVYFDVRKFNETSHYGKLSGRNIDDMLANTRDLDGQSDKKNPQDFALWKKAEPQHIMRWPSPWGIGFPGWHLECTAMSTKYLGSRFDIHGGGLDLKFPHHECEIAQNEAACGQEPVNFWMHANMLTLNGKKMAKSTGNFILPGEIYSGGNEHLSKAFPASVARFFMLQAHYRSVLDFSNDALLAAEKGFDRLMDAMRGLEDLQSSSSCSLNVKSWIQQCYDAMNDDFNAPMLIAHLFEGVRFINLVRDGRETMDAASLEMFSGAMRAFVFEVLGLVAPDEAGMQTDKLDGAVKILIEFRNTARANRDFTLSDQIRDRLLELGIELKDGKEGTTFSF